MFAIGTHLYRKTCRCATGLLLGVLLLFSFCAAEAQRPEMRRPESDPNAAPAPAKKSKRGPRALAVVEFLPGGATRLVPIALWIDGKYYDASLYGANPEPLAVEPGTVYEAQAYGEPTGTFVVNTPKQVNGSWVADGRWKPHLALDEKLAADAAKRPKAKSSESHAIFTGDPDEGPPVLQRSGGSGSTAKDQPSAPASSPSSASPGTSAKPAQTEPAQTASSQSGRPTLGPADSDSGSGSTAAQTSGGNTTPSEYDPNRPVLKRSPADSSNSRSSDSDNDPDRPVLTRPVSSASTTTSDTHESIPAPDQDENDPDRPVLSRGKPAAAGKAAPVVAGKPSGKSAGVTSQAKALPAGKLLSYPAISDAGQYETRSLLYAMTPEQRQQKAPPMLALALADIRAFAAKRPGPAVPKTAVITDYDLRLFDLDFSNSPTMVLTAKLPVAGGGSKPFVYYATIVARLDINDQPQKIFSAVTDTAHLDVYPRLELVDAIDADANGRGDLLFRQYSDVGSSYGLYRVFPYQMEKVFEGGSSL